MDKMKSTRQRNANDVHGDIDKLAGQGRAIIVGLLTEENIQSLCPEYTSTLIKMVGDMLESIEEANGHLWALVGPVSHSNNGVGV